MVLFFESRALDPPVTIYMGIDKFENEDLLKYAFEEDVWFHVDKLSSAHVYLRMPQGMTWEAIPAALLEDLGQLTKANSIQGNKEKNTQIIYTPAANVMKRGDFATGTVSFHSQHKVKRYLVKERENAIVNRLNKTKKTVQVDHEAVRQDRERQKGREKKAKATEERNARLAEERQRDADRKARDYSSLYSSEAIEESKAAKQYEKNRAARAKAEAKAAGDTAADDEEDEGDESDDSAGSFM